MKELDSNLRREIFKTYGEGSKYNIYSLWACSKWDRLQWNQQVNDIVIAWRKFTSREMGSRHWTPPRQRQTGPRGDIKNEKQSYPTTYY